MLLPASSFVRQKFGHALEGLLEGWECPSRPGRRLPPLLGVSKLGRVFVDPLQLRKA